MSEKSPIPASEHKGPGCNPFSRQRNPQSKPGTREIVAALRAMKSPEIEFDPERREQTIRAAVEEFRGFHVDRGQDVPEDDM